MSDNPRSGFFFALSAYLIWGTLPLFWKLTEHLDPVEVTAHRAFWSLPIAVIVCFALRRTGDMLPALKSPRKVATLFLTSCLVSFNWGVFIWAITVERVLDTALAYYINPLISVLLGYVFLGERFSRLQFAAITIATAAVVMLTFVGGQFPLVSLALALTFGLYGLIRKTVDVGPTQGFLIEILLIFPIVAGFIGWKFASGTSVVLESPDSFWLMILAGPATATPLILFSVGAKRLRLSTIGLMQFLVPTMIFLIGVYLFKEPMRDVQLAAFVMIWIALVLYAISIFHPQNKERAKEKPSSALTDDGQ
ncbi:MAG: EamA family transporter RarD [Rhizobiaceae bacterium]|nr:EamA family transporter RarD [Rhizobiaceae bacterium]